MRKIFITGASGLLGRAIVKQGQDKEGIHKIYGSYYSPPPAVPLDRCQCFNLDVRDKKAVFQILDELKPEVVIHTASMGSVDWCQNNKKEAYQINVVGTKNVLSWCQESGSRFVFISSNAVFDGANPPYEENDKTDPVNYYGELKLVSERDVLEGGGDCVIIRPILAYGWNDPNERLNPVTWLVKCLSAGEKVKLVNDRFSNPLFSENFADAVWRIIEKAGFRIYNIGGKDIVSRYEFGLKIAEVFDLSKDLIESVPSSFFKNIAPRPVNTSYSTTKIEIELGLVPLSLQEGLALMRDNKF